MQQTYTTESIHKEPLVLAFGVMQRWRFLPPYRPPELKALGILYIDIIITLANN